MSFTTTKESLISFLEELKILGGIIGYLDKVHFVDTVIQNLKDNKFTVVIAGEFARGKTTFLKALTGGLEFLPDAIQANTGVVTSVEYSEDKEQLSQFEIIYKYGSPSELLPIEDIKKYNEEDPSTKKNPTLENIEKIRVWSNLGFLSEGILIVDTPGLGSVYEHHREITYDQITKSDACIFIMSIRNAAGATEISFLKDIKKYLNKVFFILNNADVDDLLKNPLVLDTEMGKIFSQLNNQDITNLSRNQLFPVSSQWGFVGKGKEKAQSVLNQRKFESWDQYFNREKVAGFEQLHKLSGFQQFEEAFQDFIYNGEKAKEVLMAPIKRIQNCLVDFKDSLAFRVQSLKDDTTIEELEKKIKLVNNEINVFEEKSQNTLIETRLQFKNLITKAENQARTQFGRARVKIKEEIQREGATFNQINNIEFRNLIDDIILREINKVAENLIGIIQQEVEDLIEEHYKKDQKILGSLIEDINYDFDFSIPQIELPKIYFDEDILQQFDEELEVKNKDISRHTSKLKEAEEEFKKTKKVFDSIEEDYKSTQKDVTKKLREVRDLDTNIPVYSQRTVTRKIGERQVDYQKIYYEKRGWFKRLKFWPHEKKKTVTELRTEPIYGPETIDNSEKINGYKEKIKQKRDALRVFEEQLDEKEAQYRDNKTIFDKVDKIKKIREKAVTETEEAIRLLNEHKESTEKEMKEKEIKRFFSESQDIIDSLIDNQIQYGDQEIKKNLKNYFKIFRAGIETEYSDQIRSLQAKFDQLLGDKKLKGIEKLNLESFIVTNKKKINTLFEKIKNLEESLKDN